MRGYKYRLPRVRKDLDQATSVRALWAQPHANSECCTTRWWRS